MSKAIRQVFSTPDKQTERADSRQVQNNAGGYTFAVDDKTRLTRFLNLGTDGGTYYVEERPLTKENVSFVQELIIRDEQLVIDTVTEISTSGRAFRNSPAIFTVAALFAYGKIKSSKLVQDVCRTSTHLFEFADYIELMGGWGSAKRRAVADWYTSKSLDQLAYQVVKYRQRNGWKHRDLLRLSHPVGLETNVADFILGKNAMATYATSTSLPDHIRGFLWAQESQSLSETLAVMRDYPKLPWEAYPTTVHNEPEFWATLFNNGALRGQALLRNVTRLAKLGLFANMRFAAAVAAELTNEESIKKTRLHPFNYLLAMFAYDEGTDVFGSYTDIERTWLKSSIITAALNEGFYKTFKYVEPAGKRTFIGLDVSGSMEDPILNMKLPASAVVACVAMTLARTEPMCVTYGFSHELKDLGINPSMSLTEILDRTHRMTFGSTDCSAPMTFARERKIEVDTFVIMTDNETWSGGVHPHIELQKYRKAMGINARLVVAATTPTQFSIADPTDAGMLDICGADANFPKLVTEFSAGRI